MQDVAFVRLTIYTDTYVVGANDPQINHIGFVVKCSVPYVWQLWDFEPARSEGEFCPDKILVECISCMN